MNDLVSIILPIYNGEKFMRESICSIINQTYSNWELLILDDCSTDETANIAKEYVNADSRIKYFRNESNLKLPRNLNKGFSMASGDYLTWTSDDNIYHPTALRRMIDVLKNSKDIDFVFASFDVIDENGNIVDEVLVNEKSISKNKGANSVGACFLYTRRVYEKVGDYDPDCILVEDYDYWLRIMAYFKTRVISDKLYYYRWHEDALTSTMKKSTFYENVEKVLLKNRKLYEHFSLEENYWYYQSLSEGRDFRKIDNPYRLKYKFYFVIHYFKYNLKDKASEFFKR